MPIVFPFSMPITKGSELSMPRKKYDLSPEQFVETWEKSTSSQEAAGQLGMPQAIAHAQASAYRAQGIKLKKMPHGPRPLDVEGLNRLVEKDTDWGNGCWERGRWLVRFRTPHQQESLMHGDAPQRTSGESVAWATQGCSNNLASNLSTAWKSVT
jgi:hypothetical protein